MTKAEEVMDALHVLQVGDTVMIRDVIDGIASIRCRVTKVRTSDLGSMVVDVEAVAPASGYAVDDRFTLYASMATYVPE